MYQLVVLDLDMTIIDRNLPFLRAPGKLWLICARRGESDDRHRAHVCSARPFALQLTA